jgi:hypothetical protein
MTDYSGLHAETETRLERVLAALRDTLTDLEREEVLEFLKVREYGLALDVLSHILIEEDKPIEATLLHQIDDIALAMNMRDERFMHDLHNLHDHREHPQGPR